MTIMLKTQSQVQAAFQLILCCIPSTKQTCRQRNAERNMGCCPCTCLASSVGFLFAFPALHHRTNC